MARLYDLMVLIDASAPDERRSAIVDEVQGLIEQGGTIASAHDWGSRKMTFEIDHRPEADYRLWQFEAEPGVLDRLDHSLKIMDGVLRFRIIRQIPGGPPVPPPPDPVRAPRGEESDGRVAARAAADAPAEPSEAEAKAEPAEAPEAPVAAEADAPAPAEA